MAKQQYVLIDGIWEPTGGTGSAGPPGEPGIPGPPGDTYLNASWNFNQTTAVAPASGQLRMNAVAYDTTTTLWIHETDRDSLNRAAGLNELSAGDTIILQSIQGRAVWAVTAVTDTGAYRTVSVSIVEFTGLRPNTGSIVTLYIVSPGGSGGGSSILTGTTAPTLGDGVAGSYYLDTDDQTLYGPKGADWPVALYGRSDVLVLGPASTIPVGTAEGTVIVRMTEDTTAELTATVTVWNGLPSSSGDTVAPGPVTSLHTVSTSESGVVLAWTNPTDADLATIIVRRATGSTPPATATSGTAVTLTAPKTTNASDTGLAASTTYAYAVFTVDVSGNVNTSGVTLIATTTSVIVPPSAAPPWNNTLVLDEQWTTLDLSRWGVETDSSTYGVPANQVQKYRVPNAVVSTASSGGAGNSLKLVSKRENYMGFEFTAGMIGSRKGSDSNGTGSPVYYPRYGRYEIRHKIPHGQGIWPAFWLRHHDGAGVCEVDIMEYFESQVPGRLSVNLHRVPSAGASLVKDLNHRHTFFETPLSAYQATGNVFHITMVDILPWTASTVAGGTYGDPTQPSTNVLFRWWLNGQVYSEYVDTSAYYWSSLYEDDAFDICIQGCQIGGTWNGHPDDPVGYSRWLSGGRCIIGGTAPNSCTKTYNSITNIGPVFPSTYEIDYVRVYKYTGSGVTPGSPSYANNAEGGTAGSYVTGGNSGGASGNAFATISANTVQYTSTSPLVGTKSFEIMGAPDNSGAHVGWNAVTLGSMPLIYGRMYVNLTAYPTSATGLIAMGKDADAGATTWRIGIGTGGAMRFGVSSFISAADTSPIMSLNTTYRLEWMVNSTTGNAEIRVYTSGGTLHAAGLTTFTPTAATQWAVFGRPSTGSGLFVMKFDGVAIGTNGWLGTA